MRSDDIRNALLICYSDSRLENRIPDAMQVDDIERGQVLTDPLLARLPNQASNWRGCGIVRYSTRSAPGIELIRASIRCLPVSDTQEMTRT